MAEIEYPGIAKLVPGDRAFEPHYSDQNPSEIVDFRGVFLFFVYCGAKFDMWLNYLVFYIAYHLDIS